jgi:hypothetical protein
MFPKVAGEGMGWNLAVSGWYGIVHGNLAGMVRRLSERAALSWRAMQASGLMILFGSFGRIK